MALPFRLRSLLAAALLSTTLPLAAVAQEKPLRLVINVGLQTLDPIAGPSFVTRNFSYMVWDTLVSVDSKGQYKPQMLQGWTISADGLSYTFTLRPGLEFSDGAPVTAEDCIASLRRWGLRDGLGRRLMAATKDLRAVDAVTFVLELSRPFGLVIEALGKPSVQVPFIMPARIASVTPPTTPVKEIVGSGPFLFLRDQWVPGERAVFARNPRYVPRDEPADGLAGGKVVKVERAEFLNLTDPGLRAAALQNNEVDYLEYAPIDYLPTMQANRNLVIAKAGGEAQIMAALSLNHTQAPFNNVKFRRAAQVALDRAEILAGLGLPDGLAQPDCTSMFMCGTFYQTTGGTELVRETGADRARQMLKEAGYNNERVVFLQPADSALLNPLGLVMQDRLKRAGFNVDVQVSDWSTIAQRWIGKASLDAGGWSAIPVVYTGFDMANPLGNPGTGYNCSGNQPWGYCSEAMKPVLAQFEAERDSAKRQALAGQLQELAYADATFPIAGQFSSPAVWRRELNGVIDFGFPVLWNIERRKP